MPYGYTKPLQAGDYRGVPYGQKSSLFAANPYQNQYAGFARQAQNYGQRFLDRRLANDPLGAGGMLSSPEAFRSAFGFSDGYVSPNNPNLSRWMENLQGGQQALLRQGVNRMANAGIASTRGGMGVMGGVDPRSQMAQQAMATLAGRYSDDFSKAVEWERQRALLSNQAADAMLRAYGDIYRTDVNAGLGLFGQQLEATRSGAQDLMQYLQMLNQAYGQDIDWANQQRAAGPQLRFQRWENQQKMQEAQRKLDQQQRIDQMLRTLSTGGGLPDRTYFTNPALWQAFGELAYRGQIPGWTVGSATKAAFQPRFASPLAATSADELDAIKGSRW